MSSRAETGVDSLDEAGTMAGMSNREPVAWAVFDGPDRMHLAPGYGEAESCAEDIGGEIVPLYRAPRWIPVSERLPEPGESLLIAFRVDADGKPPLAGCNGKGWLITVASVDRIDGQYLWTSEYGDESPSHWMPLPEPPEVK